MKENSNFLFVIDYFFSISIVDFFGFTCAVYLVTLGNFDKMQFKCSSCQWFQLLGFAIALKNYIIVDIFNGIIINNIYN